MQLLTLGMGTQHMKQLLYILYIVCGLLGLLKQRIIMAKTDMTRIADIPAIQESYR